VTLRFHILEILDSIFSPETGNQDWSFQLFFPEKWWYSTPTWAKTVSFHILSNSLITLPLNTQ
jgi:hypothetical protein